MSSAPGMVSFFYLRQLVSLVPWLAVSLALPAQTAPAAGTPAFATSLLRPLGLAYDAGGNLYIAESGSHLIRRLDVNGTITTVAGTFQGFSGDGGLAARAALDAPHGLALDASGNVYVADTRNQRIRRIDAQTSIITTVAGTGVQGFSGDGGQGVAARLSEPTALALDAANHLYIADTGNHRIREIDLTSGVITSVAGTGAQGFSGDGGLATGATMDAPTGLALDVAGDLYIADTGNHRLRMIDAATRKISTLAGANGGLVRLERPGGLGSTSTGVILADAGLHQLYQFERDRGSLRVVAGQGTQAFAGDGGAAGAAMLDSPTALAISPTGSIVVADTGNARVRQIDASTGTIRTIAGLGTLSPGSLSLTGAAVQSYGSTVLAATFSSSAVPSSGILSLLDVSAGGTSVVAQTRVSGATIAFALPALAAGTHHLFATYPGDASHGGAQSQTVALVVAPKAVTATVVPPQALLFGQPIPTMSVNISGVQPADAGSLALSVTTDATVGSPPGTYAVRVSMSGAAAANYSLSVPSASLVISKAPVAISLLANGSNLMTQVASSTVGVPTGTIALLTSAGTRIASLPLSTGGTAIVSAAGLPEGDYQVVAIYSGDVDFLSAQSAPLAMTLGVPKTPADFSFTANGAMAQTVNSGETAQFSFGFRTSGSTSLAGPVALSVSGLPPFATATFNPPVIPPGGAVTSFNLSVVTARSVAGGVVSPPVGGLLAVAAIVPFLYLGRRRRHASFSLLSLFAATMFLCGCGARINSAASTQPVAKTYPVTVTGTTTLLDGTVLQHTMTASLTVQ